MFLRIFCGAVSRYISWLFVGVSWCYKVYISAYISIIKYIKKNMHLIFEYI